MDNVVLSVETFERILFQLEADAHNLRKVSRWNGIYWWSRKKLRADALYIENFYDELRDDAGHVWRD